MWALILRYGLPEEPPLGDVPFAVLCLERRDESRGEPLVMLTPDAVAEEVAVRRAA
jgi:hypothetical protein